jgi:hypothetical protein
MSACTENLSKNTHIRKIDQLQLRIMLYQPTARKGIGHGKPMLVEPIYEISPPRESPDATPPSSGDARGPIPLWLKPRRLNGPPAKNRSLILAGLFASLP